jgi:hypothetical protein
VNAQCNSCGNTMPAYSQPISAGVSYGSPVYSNSNYRNSTYTGAVYSQPMQYSSQPVQYMPAVGYSQSASSNCSGCAMPAQTWTRSNSGCSPCGQVNRGGQVNWSRPMRSNCGGCNQVRYAQPVNMGCGGCQQVSYAQPMNCGCRQVAYAGCGGCNTGCNTGCNMGCGQVMNNGGCVNCANSVQSGVIMGSEAVPVEPTANGTNPDAGTQPEPTADDNQG